MNYLLECQRTDKNKKKKNDPDSNVEKLAGTKLVNLDELNKEVFKV